MKVTLWEDTHPDPDFYYHQQFAIYHEPYLIWDRETWETILATCDVYRIEIDGICGGDVVLEDRGKGLKYVVDFSVLPDYQGKGIGKFALEQVKKMAEKLTAVTRKETLRFFVKSGFVLRKTLKNYYHSGVHGYYIVFERINEKKKHEVYVKEGGEQKMLTLRKKIAKVLEEECLELEEISKLFGMREKEVLDHLQHIAKSARPERLTVEPALCKQCGFSFKKRTRLNTPGRCPVCRGEHISPPRFRIDPS